MKVAMARLEPNKPTVMPMVTGESLVVNDNMAGNCKVSTYLGPF
jgi:hypothetical protein